MKTTAAVSLGAIAAQIGTRAFAAGAAIKSASGSSAAADAERTPYEIVSTPRNPSNWWRWRTSSRTVSTVQ